jgi:hypothetical protein
MSLKPFSVVNSKRSLSPLSSSYKIVSRFYITPARHREPELAQARRAATPPKEKDNFAV